MRKIPAGRASHSQLLKTNSPVAPPAATGTTTGRPPADPPARPPGLPWRFESAPADFSDDTLALSLSPAAPDPYIAPPPPNSRAIFRAHPSATRKDPAPQAKTSRAA